MKSLWLYECHSALTLAEMAGNIIPAIATTNAMTAGLCVLQAFKVLREDYNKARMVFLSKSEDRIVVSEPLRPPKPDCSVCGITQARIEVDLSRATLEDLVENVLRKELGYGAEFTVSSEAGILFDPELDDNLLKRLTELDIKQDSFLTIDDEDDDEPRVNLVLLISDKPLPKDSNPIVLTTKFTITRKPKAVADATLVTNGASTLTSGTTNGNGQKRKRAVESEEVEADVTRKRGKVAEEAGTARPATNAHSNAVIIEDHGNGSILIDDD